MNRFEPWLQDIRAKPEEWLAPVIRSGEADLALELIRDNRHLLDVRFSGNTTPLMEAAFSGQPDIADRLLAIGAKLDFITAIALGRTGAVRVMLAENPGLVRKHSPDGWSALHIAARYGDTELLTLLVSAGADVNDNLNKSGLTPLFFATREPYSNAELLLAKGADVDARGKHGFTALHCAAMAGNLSFVVFLLAHGARDDLQTDARQTAWAIAVRQGHRNVAAFLNHR